MSDIHELRLQVAQLTAERDAAVANSAALLEERRAAVATCIGLMGVLRQLSSMSIADDMHEYAMRALETPVPSWVAEHDKRMQKQEETIKALADVLEHVSKASVNERVFNDATGKVDDMQKIVRDALRLAGRLE